MRRLSLAKETLAELTDTDLVAVAGGITGLCPHESLTCNGPCHSDFQQCLTGRCVETLDACWGTTR